MGGIGQHHKRKEQAEQSAGRTEDLCCRGVFCPEPGRCLPSAAECEEQADREDQQGQRVGKFAEIPGGAGHAPEHPAQLLQGGTDAVRAEQDPAGIDDKQRIDAAEQFREEAIGLRQPDHTLQDQEKSVEQAPEDKIPLSAVPQSGREENDQKVQNGAERSPAVPSQRDIEIIAEPVGKGNVPAPPEFADGLGAVGQVKVFPEGKTERFRQSDSHIGIAGEIEIDLQCVKNRRRPAKDGRQFADGTLQDLIDREAERVCQQDLFPQSVTEALQAGDGIREAQCPVFEVRLDIPVFDDRPGDELREEGYI